MRIRQLEYLVALKKYGSFLKTSQELYVTQPSISTAIKELEEELGYSLLNRNNKGIAFTAEGEIVFEKAERILAEIYDIKNLCKEKIQLPYSSMKIGYNTRFVSALSINVFLELQKSYPAFNIALYHEQLDTIISQLQEQCIDIGILQIDSVDEAESLHKIQEAGLAWIELMCDELVFIVNQQHPCSKKHSVTLREILQYPYVTAKSSVSDSLKSLFIENGYAQNIIYLNDKKGVLSFIQNATATTYMANHHPDCAGFTVLSVADIPFRYRLIWLQRVHERTMTEELLLQSFFEQCKKIVG